MMLRCLQRLRARPSTLPWSLCRGWWQARGLSSTAERNTELALYEQLLDAGWPKEQQKWQTDARNYARDVYGVEFKSKSGDGEGIPDGLLVDDKGPLAVTECKGPGASVVLDTASNEAKAYAKSFLDKEIPVLAIGVARVAGTLTAETWKSSGEQWHQIMDGNVKLNRVPRPCELRGLLKDPKRLDVQDCLPTNKRPLT